MDYSNYPRVTSILDATKDPKKEAALLRWRKKLEAVHGVEGAALERERILQNGTDTHTAIERYLGGLPADPEGKDISYAYSFLKLLKNEATDMVIERRFYHHTYEYQGKPDLIARYEDKDTIFDWTTGAYPKKKEWVRHKFVQAGAYALAVEQELNRRIELLTVVVLVENNRRYQIFSEDPEEYKQEFLSRLAAFKVQQLQAAVG